MIDLSIKLDLESGWHQQTVGHGSMYVYLGAKHVLKLERHLNQAMMVQ